MALENSFSTDTQNFDKINRRNEQLAVIAVQIWRLDFN